MLLGWNYNPDVLSCLTNLSSDEVFTPPGAVNQILDLSPPGIFTEKDMRFLDPVNTRVMTILAELVYRLD